VTILDATGSQLGLRIQRALADTAAGGVRPVLIRVAPDGLAAAESSATFAVRSRARAGVLVLDSATLAGRRARYAGRNAASLADVERLREVVRREVLGTRIERAGLPAERVAEITGPRLRLLTTSVTDAGARGSGAGGMIVAALVAFLLYMMILLYGQNVLRSVLEEKTTRVAEVVMASVKPDVLMAGKVLGVGAVGLVQQLVWVGGAFLISAEVAPLLRRAAGPGAAAGAARQAADAADATAAFALPTIGPGWSRGRWRSSSSATSSTPPCSPRPGPRCQRAGGAAGVAAGDAAADRHRAVHPDGAAQPRVRRGAPRLVVPALGARDHAHAHGARERRGGRGAGHARRARARVRGDAVARRAHLPRRDAVVRPAADAGPGGALGAPRRLTPAPPSPCGAVRRRTLRRCAVRRWTWRRRPRRRGAQRTSISRWMPLAALPYSSPGMGLPAVGGSTSISIVPGGRPW
jgi:hypothetical protein